MDIERSNLASYASVSMISEGCMVWVNSNNGQLEIGKVYRAHFHGVAEDGLPRLISAKVEAKEKNHLIEYEHKGDGRYKITTKHDPGAKDCYFPEFDDANEFSHKDIDLIRQWFDLVQDLNPDLLERQDYALAERLYKKLGMRVPNSMSEHLS